MAASSSVIERYLREKLLESAQLNVAMLEAIVDLRKEASDHKVRAGNLQASNTHLRQKLQDELKVFQKTSSLIYV